MRRFLTKKLVNQCVRYSTDLGLLYFNNNKVGCTSIKYSLWNAIDRLNQKQTFRGRIHSRKRAPFVRNIFDLDSFDGPGLATATKFSVVRNPFARILSGYLQKVGKDPHVWRPFCTRFGIREEIGQNELTFEDFLVIVASDPDELMNGHFRPQYINLLVPFTKLAFVGRLEDPGEFTRFLSGFGVNVESVRRNATNAGDSLHEYYNERCIEIVREKFADDFRLFGYSTDIRHVRDFESVLPANPETDFLVNWIITGEPPVSAFDTLGQAYQEFVGATSVEHKVDCVRRWFRTEDNWSRLRAYRDFAADIADEQLTEEIRDRISHLKNQHRARVKNQDIFVSV